MTHRYKFWTLSGCSSLRTALSLVFCLLCFGAVNGSASQTVHALVLQKASLVGEGWPALASPNSSLLFYYYVGSAPSYYEAFPFLRDLRYAPSGAPSNVDEWVPYGTYPLNLGGFQKYPYIYRARGSRNVGTIPDDYPVSNINSLYNSLSEQEKFALTGNVDFQTQTIDGQTAQVVTLKTYDIGSSAGIGNGVYTYSPEGSVIVSFPDASGYVPGHKQLPDGSFAPTYYDVSGSTPVEVSAPPTVDYSSLSVDESGQYNLQIPDYSSHLNTIIDRIDNINLTYDPVVNVSPPEVNVNVPAPVVNVSPPEVNVNVPAPVVNVSSPEVNVTVDGSDLTDIESSLVGIGSLLEGDDHPVYAFTNNLELSSEDQSLVDQYRDWETNIPLIGSAVDFGLNTLLGKLPAVGTEYVWLDMDIGSPAKRDVKASSGVFSGAHVRISVEKYRPILLAARGWLIIAEALLFVVKTYRLVREACIA